MENSDKPAYPLPNPDLTEAIQYQGLSKREIYAMSAMQGLCSYHGTFGQNNNCEVTARRAIEMADELLKQLEK